MPLPLRLHDSQVPQALLLQQTPSVQKAAGAFVIGRAGRSQRFSGLADTARGAVVAADAVAIGVQLVLQLVAPQT